ncbi:MAG: hypothetical protein ACK515_01235, partial [bacterium]
MSAIAPPYPLFSDRDGSPLEAGYIWIGVENLNAITDPVAVYWDAALTQPAAQPIRTQSGYPVNAGTPARFYTAAAYSILVQDRNGVTVYSSASDNADAQPAIVIAPAVRNRFANGAFVFDQRNNGATVTVNSTAEARCQDCWIATGQSADGVFTVTQQATGGPVDSPNFSRITVTTADAAIGSGQFYTYSALIEGRDVADLGFGTANARAVSVGFWFRSSITGTFSGSLRNAAANRSYSVSWSYLSANAWQYVSLENLAGDTAGTWPTGDARSLLFSVNVGAGSTLLAPSGAWVAGNVVGTTGSVQLISTLNATMDIALVQVEAGSTCTPFEWTPYQSGLARVARYLPVIVSSGGSEAIAVGQCTSTTRALFTIPFSVPTRFRVAGVIVSASADFQILSAGAG